MSDAFSREVGRTGGLCEAVCYPERKWDTPEPGGSFAVWRSLGQLVRSLFFMFYFGGKLQPEANGRSWSRTLSGIAGKNEEIEVFFYFFFTMDPAILGLRQLHCCGKAL